MSRFPFLETAAPPVLFVSDLHLNENDPDSGALFIDLLMEAAGRIAALYILGDLFEVWLGDDAISPEQKMVLTTIQRCTQLGTPVFVQHGNRDFLLGPGFEKQSGATLIPDPYVINLNGQPTLLAHGDSFCIDDAAYQAFRTQVRNADWQRQFLSLPLAQRQAIANEYRQESRRQTRQKSLAIMDVNKQATLAAMTIYACPQLIHGHTHRPGIHYLQMERQAAQRYVLGDWQQGPVIAVSEVNKISLISL